MTQKKMQPCNQEGKIVETRINTSFFWLQFSKKSATKNATFSKNATKSATKRQICWETTDLWLHFFILKSATHIWQLPNGQCQEC